MNDQTIEWLKENDPDYFNRNKLEYAYLSKRQEQSRQKKEKPASCIKNPTLHENLGLPFKQPE